MEQIHYHALGLDSDDGTHGSVVSLDMTVARRHVAYILASRAKQGMCADGDRYRVIFETPLGKTSEVLWVRC